MCALFSGAICFSAHAQNPAAPRQTSPAPVRPVAPSATNPNTPEGIANSLQNAERNQNADSLLLLYGQAVTQPDLARAAIAGLLSNYYSLRNRAQTADQATQAVSEAMLRFSVLQAAQNQVLIQQNQQILQQNARVIALLEAQSRPRTAPNVPTAR